MTDSSIQKVTQTRNINYPLYYFAFAVVVIGIILIILDALIPSLLPYRDIVLVVAGFMLGFATLIMEEYFVSSIERAENERKDIKITELLNEIKTGSARIQNTVENPIERKQRDAAVLGGWTSFMIFPPDETPQYDGTYLHRACNRLDIPKTVIQNYEKIIRKYEVTPSNPVPHLEMLKATQEFIHAVSLSSPEIAHIFNLTRLATLNWFMIKKFSDSKSIFSDDGIELKQFVDVVNIQNAEFDAIEKDLVGEVKRDLTELSMRYNEVMEVVNRGLKEKSYKNSSDFNTNLRRMEPELMKILLKSVSPY